MMVFFFPTCLVLILCMQSRGWNQVGAAPRSCFTLFYFLGGGWRTKMLFSFL